MATALAMEEVAGSTFANGLQLAGFVELAAGTQADPEQRSDLVALFEKFAGSSKTGKVMPLDAGMKFNPLGMKPEDAQLLETGGSRSRRSAAGSAPFPVLIGHAAQGQTMWGSGIEQARAGLAHPGLGPN
jgi:phage portal protein BeeE